MKLDLSKALLNEVRLEDYKEKLYQIDNSLRTTKEWTAWLDYPENFDRDEFQKITRLAKTIQEKSDALVVVGIGGSYLGAKAGLDILAPNSKTQVVFAGINLDYSDLKQKLESLKDKDVYVNVVSKSGGTCEILVALNLIENFMKEKYGDEYTSRIIYTTDKTKGYLRKIADEKNIDTLSVPDNMGGRYSVLSAVGLLPFAVASVDIQKIFDGARKAYEDLSDCDIEKNVAMRYALYRYLINTKLDKKIELFSSFSHSFSSFGAWLQQLFCESEGKEGKGLFVAPLTFSTDLHSVGQFIQQGTSILAETFIEITTPKDDIVLKGIDENSPIKYLDGKTFFDVTKAGFNGTVKAHSDAKVPIAIISIDEINEFNYGYLVYFFELSCAYSGKLLGVNPFDQPGVEQYKAYMKENLK